MSQAIASGRARPSRIGAALLAWAEAERGRFTPWLAVALVAGAAGYFALPWQPQPWPCAAAVALAGALAGLLRHRMVARAAAAMLLAASLGFAAGQWATLRALPTEPLPTRAVVLGAVVRGVDLLPDGRRLLLGEVRLAPDAAPLARAVRVRAKRGDETPVQPGDRIEVRALLRPPAPPAYPGAWDLQRDSFFNGLAGGGTALGPVTVKEHAAPTGPRAAIEAMRHAIATRATAALPGAEGAVAAALLTGGTRAIPEADRAAFRDSGLAHLLAVAGLHIGIVMGLVMLTTRLALAAWPHAALHWPTKAIGGVAALCAGSGYLLLTGAHVPILRSFAMASLVTLGVVVGRRALSLRGLALGAAALVAVAPHEVVGVSFQMSFAAVLALITGYEALRPWLARLYGPGWRRVASHVAALVLTSLLAGTASAPYGAFHFGHVQLYFIAANVLAVPLMAFWTLPLGVAAVLLMPFGLEGLAFAPMGWGLHAIIGIARAVSAWPAATVATPPMPGWGLAVFSLGLAWLCLWRTRMRLAGLLPILLGLLSPLLTPLPDILVSPDARLIALRQPGFYAVQSRPGAARFVHDAWQEHLAAGPLRPIADDTPGCTATACRMGAALLLRGTAQRADCSGVGLVVSAEPARGVCAGARLVDRFTVWRDGAQAVWLRPDGPVILSDRAARGDRPWVPPPPVPRARASNLPAAPADLPPAPTETPE